MDDVRPLRDRIMNALHAVRQGEYRHGPLFCQNDVQGTDMIAATQTRRFAGLVLLCLCPCTDSTLAADACAHWQPVLKTPEGQVFHRCRRGSAIDDVMIMSLFRTSPERLYALVTDYEAFENFIPDVIESRVLEKSGTVQWVYHHLRFPGPVADRVYVMKSTGEVTGTPPDTWRVEWALSDRVFPQVDMTAGIRPNSLSGFWVIEAADEAGMTRAQYAVYGDPGGLVPAWLVMRMTDRYVQQVVAAVRRQLGE